jgi:type I restriction enzyme S subunit
MKPSPPPTTPKPTDLKNGWATKTLGELLQIARGGSPRPIQSFLTKSPNGINWVKIGDTKGITKYIFETEEKIKKEGVSRSRMVYDGDFILSNSMSFGRPYIMRTSGCIHDGWLLLRDEKKNLDQDFLYYLLSSDFVFNQFNNLAAGSTVRNLNIDLVRSVNVSYPTSLPEQHRIVAILDDVFERVAAATAAAEKNLANARELFESYLQRVFAEPGWEKKNFGSICQNLDGKRIPVTRKDRTEGKYPYYGASGIVDYVNKFIFNEDLLLVSEDGANLLARTYPIAFSISGPAWVNNHAHVLRFSHITSQRFVEYYLNSIKLDDFVSGMAQPKLNQKMMNSIPVPFPSLKQQEIAVTTLDALSAETKKLESIYTRKLSALEELKKSVLRQAFRGEL